MITLAQIEEKRKNLSGTVKQPGVSNFLPFQAIQDSSIHSLNSLLQFHEFA